MHCVCVACGNCSLHCGEGAHATLARKSELSEIMGELRDRVSNGEFERVCESPNLGSGQPARQPADPDRPTELRTASGAGGQALCRRPPAPPLAGFVCELAELAASTAAFPGSHLPTSGGHARKPTMLSLLLPLASGLALNHAAFSRAGNNLDVRSHAPLMQHGGKGFGGGEATRDPCVFAHQTMENAHQHHLFFRTHRLFVCALHLKSQSADRLRS